MDWSLTFLIERPYFLLVFLSPIAYFIIRDIVAIKRQKKEIIEEQERMREAEKKVKELYKTLDKQRDELIDSLQKINQAADDAEEADSKR